MLDPADNWFNLSFSSKEEKTVILNAQVSYGDSSGA
jgi:hypothetical protein